MLTDDWRQISRLIDYVMAPPRGKPIKESPAIYCIKGEPEKPPRKPKKGKEESPKKKAKKRPK